jgi:hypothetical protein
VCPDKVHNSLVQAAARLPAFSLSQAEEAEHYHGHANCCFEEKHFKLYSANSKALITLEMFIISAGRISTGMPLDPFHFKFPKVFIKSPFILAFLILLSKNRYNRRPSNNGRRG